MKMGPPLDSELRRGRPSHQVEFYVSQLESDVPEEDLPRAKCQRER